MNAMDVYIGLKHFLEPIKLSLYEYAARLLDKDNLIRTCLFAGRLVYLDAFFLFLVNF